MCLIEETKFASDPKAKFIFYYIIGQKMKAGCLNLIHNLLNRNVVPKIGAKSNKCK